MITERQRKAAIALYDRYTHEGMDRRLFMHRLIALTGSAAAASAVLLGIAPDPAAAQQVPEDDPRLHTGTIEWPVTQGRTMRGYSATRHGHAHPAPAVIVVHENRGLNGHIRDVARRLALAGYVAIAPDWLSDAGGTPDDPDRAREMIGALDMDRAVADGVATIRNAPGTRVSTGRVGVVGFCWGGAMVNRLAVAAGEALSAGVSFYGPAPDPAEEAHVQAAMLVILAGEDERVNRTGLPWIGALEAAGRGRGRLFPGAQHAFHNDTSAERYDREAAGQAWALTLMHFGQHLRRA